MANKARERIAALDWVYWAKHKLEKEFPEVFKEYRRMVTAARANTPSWPMDTVYAPRVAISALLKVYMGLNPSLAITQTNEYFTATSCIEAISAWDLTKGIYSFDQYLIDGLLDSNFKNIPTNFLQCPEFCILVHLPVPLLVSEGYEKIVGLIIKPAWGHNEHLGLTIIALQESSQPHIFNLPGIINHSSLQEMFDDLITKNYTHNVTKDNKSISEKLISLAINILLYLNSEKPDINRPLPTFLPRAHPGKKHIKIPHQEQIYEVGYRIGAKIRAARAKEDADWEASGETSRTRVTHIRRAHWHTYWTGSRKNNEMKPILKWLNPILVGDEELVPALHS